MLFAHKYMKMEEAGDDGSGGSGGDDVKKNADAAAAQSAQQLELLTKSVGLLAEGLKNMESNQSQIVATLAAITEQSKGEVRKDLKEEFGADVDLDQLSQKDFARYILAHSVKGTQDALSKFNSDLDLKIQDLASRFENKNAGDQVEKIAGNNKDFWEWGPEIKAILKENPTLSVGRAYNLVKTENPDKAKTLDKKYNPAPEKKQSSFIGLTPTSSIGTRDGSKGKMSQKDAANKAFNEVMDSLGDTIQNGDLKLA